MITDYIQSALKRAKYELLEDGTFYAEVPELQGLYANAPTLESCRDELKQSLEEWIVLGLQLGHNIPELDGIYLSFVEQIAEFKTWVKSHRNLNFPTLSDEAISRESIYEPLSHGINSLSDS